MYKVNRFFNSPLRRKLRELDFRAPEDRLAVEDGAQIVQSPEVGRWVDAFFLADQDGDDHGRTTALQRIIDSNRIDYASAGVPVFAHPPLPQDFADNVVKPISGLPEAERQKVVENLVAKIDPGSRALVTQQLRGPRGLAPVRPLSNGSPDPDSAGQRRRADELNARDPLAAAAHPFAYGLDTALDDVVGEDGLLGDWGWRRSIPNPSDENSAAVGELTRNYLQLAAPFGGAARVAGAPREATQLGARIAQRWGRQALIGGGLSVLAELGVSQGETTGWDVGLSFLSGATSGALEFDRPRDKARLDAALAVGTAIAGNILKREDIDIFATLGAGLAAYAISRAGGTKFAQAFGRGGRKLGEKFAKELATQC